MANTVALFRAETTTEVTDDSSPVVAAQIYPANQTVIVNVPAAGGPFIDSRGNTYPLGSIQTAKHPTGGVIQAGAEITVAEFLVLEVATGTDGANKADKYNFGGTDLNPRFLGGAFKAAITAIPTAQLTDGIAFSDKDETIIYHANLSPADVVGMTTLEPVDKVPGANGYWVVQNQMSVETVANLPDPATVTSGKRCSVTNDGGNNGAYVAIGASGQPGSGWMR